MEIAFLADGVNLHDVRMIQAGRHHGFLLKAADHVLTGMSHQRGLHDFHSHVSLQRRLFCQENVRHATAAKSSEQVKLTQIFIGQVSHDGPRSS